jgi:hypothetical protein
MASLYLSGGGLGVRADAWPAALAWLADRDGPITLASLASDDDRQARMLQRLLAELGRPAELATDQLLDPQSPRFGAAPGTLYLCGGDATSLLDDPRRVSVVREALLQPELTIIADSAAAMALGRRAASCTCGGHPIRVVDGLGALGSWSVLAHAQSGSDERLAALNDAALPNGGQRLALPTGAAVEVLGLGTRGSGEPGGIDFRAAPWSARSAHRSDSR